MKLSLLQDNLKELAKQSEIEIKNLKFARNRALAENSLLEKKKN